jgi:hypothetical protein
LTFRVDAKRGSEDDTAIYGPKQFPANAGVKRATEGMMRIEVGRKAALARWGSRH